MIVIGDSCPPGVIVLGGGVLEGGGVAVLGGSCPRGVIIIIIKNKMLFTQGSHFSYETALPADPA